MVDDSPKSKIIEIQSNGRIFESHSDLCRQMCVHRHVYDYMKLNYVKAGTNIIRKEQADQ